MCRQLHLLEKGLPRLGFKVSCKSWKVSALKNTLLGTNKIPTKTEYAATVAVDDASRSAPWKETTEDFDLNSRAFEDLIIAMNGSSNTGRVAWSLVDGAKTTDLPDGDSALAYKKLRGNMHHNWLHLMSG